jgi:hypothetical protein
VRACANKKTFRREDKIREHMNLARNQLKHLQDQEAEQEKISSVVYFRLALPR